MGKNSTTIIAGAGVAGLTAALLIANRGFHVTLLEKSSSIDRSGVGIQLSPNATHVLAELGLLEKLEAASIAPKNIVIKKGSTGNILSTFPLENIMLERYGAPYLVLHRADLANLLFDACKVHPHIDVQFNRQIEDVAMHANGVTVMALNCNTQDTGGKHGQTSEYLGAALIGADGGHSKIRTGIVGGEPATPSGDIAWRALIDIEKTPKSISKMDTTLWMGKSGHIVCYPIRKSRFLNIVAITPSSSATEIARGRCKTDGAALFKFFAKWDTDIVQLLKSTAEWHGWPLNQVEPKGNWVKGATVLIGDAAHAMLPYAAQGGAAAIEDAVMLAKSIGADREDLPSAFIDYEKKRKPRATQIWQLARTNRKIYHMGGVAAVVRNIVLGNTSSDQLYKRFEWLYGWKC